MTRPLRNAWRAMLRHVPPRLVRRLVASWVNVLQTSREPAAALRELFELEDEVTREIDRAALRLDGGVHAKHRLTRYHDFFVERIRPDDRVLDVGCGIGRLALAIAERTGASVTGLDSNATRLGIARDRSAHARVTYVEGDLRDDLPEGPYDVAVLSNVLEHLDDRVGLLRRLRDLGVRRVLVRVPSEQRHWKVPLRRELGVRHLSDPQHVLEYDEQTLRTELEAAGFRPTEMRGVWGEVWAEAVTDA